MSDPGASGRLIQADATNGIVLCCCFSMSVVLGPEAMGGNHSLGNYM